MRKTTIGASVLLLCLSTFLTAQTYRCAVGDIPGAAESNSKMMTAMAEIMKVKIDVEIVPMSRMVYMVSSGQADFGVPTIIIPKKEITDKLNYDFSQTTLVKMAFVLYTNKSKPIDVKELKKGNPQKYVIESEISNAGLFEFATAPSTNPMASLKKVDGGVIDGYILAAASADPIIQALNLKNIKRQFYTDVDTGWILPKGARGGKTDKFLAEGMKKLQQTGQLEKILGGPTTSITYDDWQP